MNCFDISGIHIIYFIFFKEKPFLSRKQRSGPDQGEIFFDKEHQFKMKSINLRNIIGKKLVSLLVFVFLFFPKRTQNQQQSNSGKTLEQDKTILLSTESLLKTVTQQPTTSSFSPNLPQCIFLNNLIKLGQTEKSWKEVGNEES